MANEYRGFVFGTGSHASPRTRRIRQHPVHTPRRPATPSAPAPTSNKAA